MTPENEGNKMNNLSNPATGAYDSRGPIHDPNAPYRVAVYTRDECIDLIKDLASKGVELRLKIEGSESHLTITKSQLVKYIKSCRWFDCYSEMVIEVCWSDLRQQYRGMVRFNNDCWS
jgi:hypothetical protein